MNIISVIDQQKKKLKVEQLAYHVWHPCPVLYKHYAKCFPHALIHITPPPPNPLALQPSNPMTALPLLCLSISALSSPFPPSI